MFNASKQVFSLRKLLTSYTSINNRQTVFASASIPQHNRFLHDCIQQKWTKVCKFTFVFLEQFHYQVNRKVIVHSHTFSFICS